LAGDGPLPYDYRHYIAILVSHEQVSQGLGEGKKSLYVIVIAFFELFKLFSRFFCCSNFTPVKSRKKATVWNY
jgi:hypothetical protein